MAELTIDTGQCVVCGSTDNLVQHHEPPIVRGGKSHNYNISKCSYKRHHGTRRQRHELIQRITAEINKRMRMNSPKAKSKRSYEK
jgi:hypothetical protein